MSKLTSTLKKKNKIKLNGKFHAYNDVSGFNELQLAHRQGVIDLYAELPQQDGGPPLPPVAEQWKEDYRKRLKYGKSTSNR